MAEKMMAFGDKLILDELIARPGQSKYLLASHIQVSPIELDTTLESLTRDGTVVQSDVSGDSEPLYWAALSHKSPSES